MKNHAPNRHDNEALQPGSTATPFSTSSGQACQAMWPPLQPSLLMMFSWDLMSTTTQSKEGGGHSWLKPEGLLKRAGRHKTTCHKEWGVCELWNIGTLTEDALEYGKQLGGRFRETRIVSWRTYKVAQCFVSSHQCRRR